MDESNIRASDFERTLAKAREENGLEPKDARSRYSLREAPQGPTLEAHRGVTVLRRTSAHANEAPGESVTPSERDQAQASGATKSREKGSGGSVCGQARQREETSGSARIQRRRV